MDLHGDAMKRIVKKLLVYFIALTFLMPYPALAQLITQPLPSKHLNDAETFWVKKANCGSLAVASLLFAHGLRKEAIQVSRLVPPTRRGYNIHELKAISAKHGLGLKAMHMPWGQLAVLPLPAIVHQTGKIDRSAGHFSILYRIDHGQFGLYDPQSRSIRHVGFAEFKKRWSDLVIIPEAYFHVPGYPIADSEILTIYGGSDFGAGNPSGGGNGGDDDDDDEDDEDPCGSPVWSVNKINMNLYIKDIPLWYAPAFGPSVQIMLSYNSEFPVSGPQIFGNKWTFNYNAHLEENADTGDVLIYMPNGAQDLFTSDGSGGYNQPYKSYDTLTKLGADHFELRFPGDTVYVFQIPAGTSAAYPMLVEVRNARGQALVLGYNAAAQLTTIADALGQETTLTYTGGRVTRAEDPFGRYATFDYDTDDNLIRITDMGGYWTALTYDANSYISSMQDDRSTTGFYIEPRDALSSQVPYPAPGGSMQQHYRITVTHPDGGKSEYFYSGMTGTSWYVRPRDYVEYVDANTNNYASNVPKKVYSYTGTIKGSREEIQSIVTPEGMRVTYTYDYNTGLRMGVTDTYGNTTSYTYNAMGMVTSETPELGAPTNYIYDAANLIDLTEIQQPGLGSINRIYNTYHQVVSQEDPSGKTIQYTYNSRGQIETITATVDGQPIVTEFIHYNAGDSSPYRVKEMRRNGLVVSEYTYDAIGRVRTLEDVTGLMRTFDYNNLNHLTRTTYPDGRFESITYSGCCPRLVDMVTDRSGRTAWFAYDASRRLIETVDPEGSRTRFEYDANGNQIRLIDANNQATTYEYDLDDRLVRTTFADGRNFDLEYNAIGLLSRRVNARGITADFDYDANHRLIAVDYSDNTASVTYQYDDFGRIVQETDGVGTSTYTYDANSRLRTADGPWPDDTITYDYDEIGRVISLNPQVGQVLTYTYDALSRITQIQSGTNVFTYDYVSNVSPLIQKLTRPNNSYTSYQYDNLNQLTAIENRTSTDTVITSSAFTFNANDLISTETLNTNDLMAGFQENMTTYDYNTVNQLLQTANPSQVFDYDDDGNMIRGYTLDGYVYTAQYDAEDRLEAITYTDSGSTEHRRQFVYGSDGFVRIIRTYENSSLVDETRLVRSASLVLQERNESSAVIREYAWGPNRGGGIGGLLNMHTAGQDYNYLYDGKGNVGAVIDNAQTVVASYRYNVFGRLMVKSGTLDQPYQFSTKRYLGGFGMSYYGYRFYSPAIGRWMNRDPLGEDGGINLFGFVHNNPVNAIDPYGEFGIVGALIGAGSDLALQLIMNGGNLKCVNWLQVGMSGALGAFTGGVLAGSLKHSKKGLSWLKSSKKWKNVRRRYRRAHNVSRNSDVHHWAIKRNGPIGKYIPEGIKNHPLNLNPVNRQVHRKIHSNSSNALYRWYHGTPRWAKSAQGSLLGGAGAAAASGGDCDCKD
jgi:RHS repeat-associated protein